MFTFALILLAGLCSGQVPGGHDLHLLADKLFNSMDHSPNDGILSHAEWDSILDFYDTDNDTCITENEYFASARLPPELVDAAYQFFDANNDKCWTLNEIEQMYAVMDHNGDDQVNMHEFEVYYQHVVKDLFGHGHGNHNGHS